MKRVLAIVLSAVMALTLLAGCGGSGSGGLPGSLLSLGGSEDLGITLSHELLDVVG